MTRNDWYELTVELIAADDAADPQRLAAIAWRLYGELGVERAEIERLHSLSCAPLRDLPEKITGGTARLEERFYNPLVRVDDDIAMVWAHYDFLTDGEVHHWGTNILSFLKQDGQWRAFSVADNGRSGPRSQSWEVT